MSDCWKFSATSEDLLQRCIAAASTQDGHNKWIGRFRKDNVINEEHNLISCEEQTEILNPVKESTKIASSSSNEELIELIEIEPIQRFDCMIEECRKNNDLLVTLAERLSAPSVEKICKLIFSTRNIDGVFMEMFYKHFIPNYLKKEYNRFCLDLIVQASKTQCILFRILLEIIIKDEEIPRQVLTDFASTFDNDPTALMNYIVQIDLSAENFINNLATLFMVYKNCTKSDQIQNYIFSNLAQRSSNCRNDKNYGKLFLAFLQNEKCMDRSTHIKSLKELIDMHRSPFRRPCETIINELYENCN